MKILKVLLWTFIALTVIDVLAGRVFRLPADVRQVPSPLQAYFNFGRSIEGKLRSEVGASVDQDSPVVRAGWLSKECDVSTAPSREKLSLDVYGMSFSNDIADYMAKLDPTLVIQKFGGPAAPPNHSYACFSRRVHAGRSLASVQILGVLASSLTRMKTISGLTTSFEGPQPFTYPRYILQADGQLSGFFPSIMTEEDLRAALQHPQLWRTFVDELAAHDAFYAPYIFQSDMFDHSVIGRLVRRALGQRFIRERTAAFSATGNFAGAPDLPPLLRVMLLDFADKTRRAGSRPIVILIENRDYGGVLTEMLAQALNSQHIEFLATSAVASSSDPANFVPDGHFKPEVNEAIARAMLALLRTEYRQ
jgi:hypothetical protein